MVRVSEPMLRLCQSFERHFMRITADLLPFPNPRASLMSTFIKHCQSYFNELNFIHNHGEVVVADALRVYANIRINFYLKKYNRKLRSEKRGNELNKDRKLNM